MVVNLLIGLPGDRPGGLILTLCYFVAAGSGALVLGVLYAMVGVMLPRVSLPLQAGCALLRGIPLVLLMFLIAHVPAVSPGGAGVVALVLYSFAQVGDTLRGFLAAYPPALSEQASLLGMRPLRAWLQLRLPWMVWRAWAVVLTHWVSLLKDTGALIVLGITELTTVAKVLSEVPTREDRWMMVLGVAAAFYLAATLLLLYLVPYVGRTCINILREEASHAENGRQGVRTSW